MYGPVPWQKDLGLVDELGGIDKALNAAATQAGIENYSIIGYPEKENIFASLLGNQKKHYINSEIKEYLGSYYNSFKALENIKDANCIQHVCRLTLISNKLHMEGNLIKNKQVAISGFMDLWDRCMAA